MQFSLRQYLPITPHHRLVCSGKIVSGVQRTSSDKSVLKQQGEAPSHLAHVFPLAHTRPTTLLLPHGDRPVR